MSVAPNAGVVDLDTFLPPTAGTDGVQGQVPKPLAGEQDYVLTASGWVPLSSLGTLVYQGTWDASTNTPTLTSSVGTAGYYYVVSVAGNTDLNGITTWTVGDWALFNGSVWQKIEGGSTVDITGGQINNTLIGNLVPAAGTFTTLTATGQTSLGGAASASAALFQTASTAGITYDTPWIFRGGQSGVLGNALTGLNPRIQSSASVNITFSTNAGTSGAQGGQEQFRISHTASAVNYVQVTGAATGGVVSTSAQGSDANVTMRVQYKGNGGIQLSNASGWSGLTITSANNPNFISLNSPATGFVPTFTTGGVDTNAGMAFISKGTGAIDLAAGSSGVNISNGGTVTAITRTASGAGYTSIPSVAISAPTTAGGVQATATITTMLAADTTTVQAGGTGYTVGDTLTIVGGTPTSGAATYRVATVSAGAVTSVTAINFANYTALATNPVTTTGGTGTGCTLNVVYSVQANSFNITNAGSGYVEQPTVTFSGGGGSGAAAYARVGSDSKVTATGSNLSFYMPAGELLRLSDPAVASPAYMQLQSGGSGVLFYSAGPTNSYMYFVSKGTSQISFATNNSSSNEQMRVAHTASAVNYVQVTGAATTGWPVISMQGSDANIGVVHRSKGSGAFEVQGGGNGTLFNISGTSGTSRNFLNVASAAAGSSPVLSVNGTDTNIGLALTPKGTGALVAQASDGGVTINARGANAVDLQMARSAVSMVASGGQSVVSGGSGNTASSTFAVTTGGVGNTTSGFASAVIGGNSNSTIGAYSFTGVGRYNVTSGSYAATVGGENNLATGFHNFIGGGYKNNGTANAAVTTQSGTMNGTTAVTLSGSNANIKVGQHVIGTSIQGDPPTYVAAISGTSLTLSQNASGSSTSTLSFYTPHGVVVGGGNNQATGSYSFIGGGGDAGTAGNRNVASGAWASVVGGIKNTASGIGSFVGGGGTDGVGNYYANTASGTLSIIVGGWNNLATNSWSSVLSGQSNTSSGSFGVITGGSENYNNSSYGVINGGQYGATRGISGLNVSPASASPVAAVLGVSQAALIVLGRQTTDATATVLTSNTSAANTVNQVILPNNSAYYFKGTVVAGKTGAGDTKGWTIEGVIKRGANAASTALVGVATVTSTYADAGAATWSITATADTTNGGLAITATGQAATTIRWVCKIETTEMTY